LAYRWMDLLNRNITDINFTLINAFPKPDVWGMRSLKPLSSYAIEQESSKAAKEDI
jgi:hypothetical protein